MSNARIALVSTALRRREVLWRLGVGLTGPVSLGGCALGASKLQAPQGGVQPPQKPPALQPPPAEPPAPLLSRLVNPDPTLLAMQLTASADLNPDSRRRASPLVVRVYELGGQALFSTADYVALFERDRETLGPELLGKEEWVLAPSATRTLDKKLAPEVKFIGLAASYRDLERARWRLVVPVRANVRNVFRLRADARALSLEPAENGTAR